MVNRIEIADAKECLDHYPSLGEIKNIAPPPQSEWHGHNAVFRVVCGAGVFYLKAFTLYPQLSTEEHEEFQDWVMEQFSPIGVQTPTTIRNAQGHRVTLCANYPFVLSAEVTGDEFHEEILAQQESAGQTLGEFHRRAAASMPRGRSSFRPLGSYLLRDTSQLYCLPDIPERAAILEAADTLVTRSLHLSRELDICGYETLPRSAVLYDYFGVHLRVCGDRVCGVLDFELSTLDARIADVGRAMTQLCCIGREAEEDGPERAHTFLRGYNAAGWPLERRELAALPLAMEIFDFEIVTFPIYQMTATGKPYPNLDLDHLFGYWMMRVRWWEEHGAEVSEQLRKLSS
jgi:Ser/Thr protein kinase RdoA (MazF antagonist)